MVPQYIKSGIVAICDCDTDRQQEQMEAYGINLTEHLRRQGSVGLHTKTGGQGPQPTVAVYQLVNNNKAQLNPPSSSAFLASTR